MLACLPKVRLCSCNERGGGGRGGGRDLLSNPCHTDDSTTAVLTLWLDHRGIPTDQPASYYQDELRQRESLRVRMMMMQQQQQQQHQHHQMATFIVGVAVG
mmetsp:Transcript_38467/g.62529  ORF Transcript_38467/g.62529 Transcript_38467/m.62529 type:complete len:101 (+) Transcript_38467:379-681(+)